MQASRRPAVGETRSYDRRSICIGVSGPVAVVTVCVDDAQYVLRAGGVEIQRSGGRDAALVMARNYARTGNVAGVRNGWTR